METKEKKKRGSGNAREIRLLFRKTIGPAFLLSLCFSLVTQFILFPIGYKIWCMAIGSAEGGYITLSNAGEFLHHPQIILVGLVLCFFYAAIIFWQIAIVITYMEYVYQGKAIHLIRVVPLSLRKTWKVIKPCNWPVLLYCIAIIPFVDLYQVYSDSGSIAIPEYIMSVVSSSTGYAIGYFLLTVVLFIVVVLGVYLCWCFVLEGKNFWPAYKHSMGIVKGIRKKIRLVLGIFLHRILSSLIFLAIPLLIITVIHIIAIAIAGEGEIAGAVSQGFAKIVGQPMIESFSNAMITAYMLCVLTVFYNHDLKEIGEELPELEDVKGQEKEYRKLGWLTARLFVIVGIGCCILYGGALTITEIAAKSDPSIVESFVADTEVVAHRGYAAEAPPNTIPALDRAIEAEAAYVEFDVQATKDHVPVVIHDANAKAITGVDANICDLTLDEVKKLDAGASFSEEFKGTPIPTLEEWLQETDHRGNLLLEIKNYNKDPKLTPAIMKLLKEYGYDDGISCIIHSGSAESLQEVKKLNPDMPCGLIIAMAVGNYYDLDYADFFSVESTFATDRAIKQIHNRDKYIFVWTVDDSDTVQKMYEKGVDGIICDNPGNVGQNLLVFDSKTQNYLANYFKDKTDRIKGRDKPTQYNTEFGD